MVKRAAGSPLGTVTLNVAVSRFDSSTLSSMMTNLSRRSYSACAVGMPQPWCMRVRSCASPLNVYWLAVLMSMALAVAICGRFSNTVAPGATGLPKIPSDHIWKNSPKWPATMGVAPLVPPKVSVYSTLEPSVTVKMLS